MILAGDIGGTKTNLALYQLKRGELVQVEQAQFASRDFASLDAVLDAFRVKCGDIQVSAACFGIAGPVIEGNCRTTNLPWDVKTENLKEALDVDKVRLLNDLEATAFGMLHLDESEFLDLNPTGRKVQGNRAVIAAGTGLGQGQLYWDGGSFHPIASEGGHSDFAPVTPQQDALLNWMRNRYPGHVSYERVLSGPAIYTLYQFLLESGFAAEPVTIAKLDDTADHSRAISECALQEKDPLCQEAMRLFVEIYGAEAGNLALKYLAFGGVYVGGGIAPKIIPLITTGVFLNSFASKGRFEEMLRGIPLRVSLNPKTALMGAAHFAAEKLR